MLNKTVSILGCGWYGLALAKSLIEQGYAVKGSTTSTEKMAALSAAGIKPYLVKFTENDSAYDPAFFDSEVLLISVPPKFRTGETAGFIPKMEAIIAAINNSGISKVIYISSTGVYGEHNREMNELSAPEPDSESGKLLLAAEDLFRQQAGFKTTVVRFGGLIGPGRHPGRFFAGKKDIPNGLAPVNLIQLDDCIGITKTILEKDAFGFLINACAPEHPTRSDFYTRAAISGGFDSPTFLNELTNWKTIDSLNTKLILDYSFKRKLDN